MAIEDQITLIEEEIKKTQYNKATSHHIGKLKAKLAKLREEREKRASAGGGGGQGYSVRKSGHASVSLVGFPSVGKSTMLSKMTDAESEVGAYEFTTLTCIPGMMEHKHAEIQVLDLPGLIKGAAFGKGRGREVIAVARSSDLVLLVADALNPEQVMTIVDELYAAGIRLNQRPADIKIFRSRDRGGITVSFTVKQSHLSEDLVKDMLKEYGIVNADVVIRDDATVDQLVDAITGNRVFLKSLIAINKIDRQDPDFVKEAMARFEARGWPTVPIAASIDFNLEKLKDVVYDTLGFISVYLKPQGKDADMDEPLVVKGGSTIGDVCDGLHRDFRRKFRYALVTGPSAKFDNQNCGIDHVLKDGDVLTIVTIR